VRENVNEMIQKEVERIEEAEVQVQVEAEVDVEIQTEIEDHGEENGDHLEHDARGEDFGPKKNKKNLKWKLEGNLELKQKRKLTKRERQLLSVNKDNKYQERAKYQESTSMYMRLMK
jgi:hypothetical protein